MKTANRKTKRTYQISYKHEQYGSDSIGCDFASVAAAQQKIEAIKVNPGQAGYADWLKDACLWVSDNKGNSY